MKKSLSILLFFYLIVTLSGCSSVAFDASGYTKACLDAAYHDEYEAYVEFIGGTVEEVKADMNEKAEIAVGTEVSSLNISVTNEQKEEYMMLLKEIEHLTKYDVGQAEEDENGFSVHVTVYPLDIYEQFLSGIDTVYQNAADTGELSDVTIFPIMIHYLEECIDNVQYKEKIETTIHVTEDSEGIWQIPEDEMYAIDDLLLPGI